MILGTVHGDKVDGHFYDTICSYYQAQIHDEHQRLGDTLREAVEHVEDPDLKAKYLEVAETRPFQFGSASIRSGPLLSMGRGRLCQTFLDHTDETWLGCSDTDMTWTPDLWNSMVRLAEQGAPLPDGGTEPIRILAAPAWIVWTGPDGTVERRVPNVYRTVTDDKAQDWLSQMTAEDLAANGYYRDIGACGGALMLIHREVLIAIRDRLCGGQPFWWHHLPTPPILTTPEGTVIHDQYGEDTSFCIRAREAGEIIWLHSGLKVGHAKTVVQY